MARLLIVEDEQRIASFLAKGLTAEGHQTTIADDGALGPAPRTQWVLRSGDP